MFDVLGSQPVFPETGNGGAPAEGQKLEAGEGRCRILPVFPDVNELQPPPPLPRPRKQLAEVVDAHLPHLGPAGLPGSRQLPGA